MVWRLTPHHQNSKALICGYLSINLPKSLKMSCSMSSVPKLYLHLRPYSPNRVCKLFFLSFDSGFLCNYNATNVGTAVLLILLWTWYVAHKKSTFQTHKETHFCTGTTLNGEWNKTGFEGQGCYMLSCDSTSCQQITTPTFYLSDSISQRHLVTLTYYHSH